MTEDQKMLYNKFKNTGQERIKLACALEGFLDAQTPLEESEEKAYREYLKRRIRPAMEKLILEEAIEKMEKIEKYSWYGKAEAENFIRFARNHHKIESMVWLMEQKDRNYGYCDRDFTL